MSGICSAHIHFEPGCRVCLADRIVKLEAKLKRTDAIERALRDLMDWLEGPSATDARGDRAVAAAKASLALPSEPSPPPPPKEET